MPRGASIYGIDIGPSHSPGSDRLDFICSGLKIDIAEAHMTEFKMKPESKNRELVLPKCPRQHDGLGFIESALMPCKRPQAAHSTGACFAEFHRCGAVQGVEMVGG